MPRSSTSTSAFAAVDLGAESGRVVLGRFDGRVMSAEVVHRFANRAVALPDGLHWNLLGLFAEVLDGLALAAERAPLAGIGVDAWGVDYGLLDGSGRLLGLPFHYRDGRTEGMVERAHTRISRDELYATTGIQTMAINTIYQLLAEGPALASAERIALLPDLFALWLSGELANEITAASTTGLLDARRSEWSRAIAGRLGLPAAPFAGGLVEPGTALGPLLAAHADRAGRACGATVRAVAGHDTASAFAAAPLAPGRRAAVLSSGTWSLVGVETAEPCLGADAAAANLTNERGLDGTTRLLRNVMGMWLIEECRRAWARAGVPCEYARLLAAAERASGAVPLFDPDHGLLMSPGEMPERIASLCRESGQVAPAGTGATVRSILLSLACKYRFVLERLADATGAPAEVLHVVGGGSRNELLCRLTASITRLEVIAGPDEATALGNALVQARAAGEVADSREQLRAVAAASCAVRVHEPDGDGSAADETYARFLAVTGLSPGRPQAVAR